MIIQINLDILKSQISCLIIFKMDIVNDKTCFWINDLPEKLSANKVINIKECDWLIIGAGYTGLSAARKLGQIHPNSKIILEVEDYCFILSTKQGVLNKVEVIHKDYIVGFSK